MIIIIIDITTRMKTFVAIFVIGITLQIGFGNALECFQCAYVKDNADTTNECLRGNVSDISLCDESSACIQLSYQDPDSDEYVSFFLGCGTTLCNDSNSDGLERVEYNSSFNNYTLRTTCCVGDYCNCNSSTCDDAVEEHVAALATDETTASYETAAVGTTETSTIDCFYCSHIAPVGRLSPECIEHNTTSSTQCDGNRCMKLSVQNTTDSSYVVYTLDCAAESKCGEDGVALETDNGDTIETVICYTGDHSNCDSEACLEAIGATTTSITMTTAIDEEPPTTDYQTTSSIEEVTEPIFTTLMIEAGVETTEEIEIYTTSPTTLKETTKSDSETTEAMSQTEPWTIPPENEATTEKVREKTERPTVPSETEKTTSLEIRKTEPQTFPSETVTTTKPEQQKNESQTVRSETEKTTKSVQNETEPVYATESWTFPTEKEKTEPVYVTEAWTFPEESNTTTTTKSSTLKASASTTTTLTTTSSATSQHAAILFHILTTAIVGLILYR